MVKYGRTYFSLDGFTVAPGPSWGLAGFFLTVFIKYWSYNPNFDGHGFSAENNKIMMEFCGASFTQLLSFYRVDDELYESLRRKPG